MKIIGVTGGIGCGKSEVLNFIASHYDATIMKADQIGHILMQKGRKCYGKIVATFGEGILRENGEIDRSKLAHIVFPQPEELAKLNAIMHPAIKNYILHTIEKEKNIGTEYFIVEAALLLEDHYDDFCDEVWYIYADEDTRVERLKESRDYTEEKIAHIVANQLTEDEFERRCSVEIDNSGNFSYTERQIRRRLGDEAM